MNIPNEAKEAAWVAMAEAMGLNHEDRGMYEMELLDGLEVALSAASGVIAAQAWDMGFASGKSRAMRHMSDEPNLPLTAPNPYREDAA